MPGPPPQERRRRRNADTYADVQTKVSAKASRVHGPTMFAATGGALDLYDEPVRRLTERWWETWRRSPIAEHFLDTDWSRLIMLIPLVASYYASPHHMKLAEIRQNESLLGATHVDRLKARIKVESEPPPATTAPGVTAMDDYRGRLAG